MIYSFCECEVRFILIVNNISAARTRCKAGFCLTFVLKYDSILGEEIVEEKMDLKKKRKLSSLEKAIIDNFPEAKLICQKCREEIDPRLKRCPKCGTKV